MSKMHCKGKAEKNTLCPNLLWIYISISFLSMEFHEINYSWKYLTHHLGIDYYDKFSGCIGTNRFQLKWRFGTHGKWKKNQNPGGRFEATALPIWPIFTVNGLNWQCCLDGSSKTAPRILIFSIAIGAKPSFWLKSIAT